MNRTVLLCGHSHRQSLTQIPGGPLILNPGTVGCLVSPDNKLALSLEFRLSESARRCAKASAGDGMGPGKARM